MKNYINYTKTIILISIVLFGIQSCSKYLELVPDDIPTIDTVFETRTGALNFRTTIYSYLPRFNDFRTNPAQMTGDEAWLNEAAFTAFNGVFGRFGPQDIARGLQSVDNAALDSWGDMYRGIRDCNVFLENLDAINDISNIEREQWRGEAKVLKAYYHFFLMRQYGPIVIVRDNFGVNTDTELVQLPRSSVDEVAQYIIELIDEGIQSVPGILANEETEYGIITKPIAAAIKARTLVTVASPLFNGNTDYSGFTDAEGNELINSTFDASKWEAAANACKEAIDLAELGGHELYEFNEVEIGETLSDSTLLKMSIRGSYTSRLSNEVIWPATGRPVNDQRRALARLDVPNTTPFILSRIESFHSPTLRVAEMFYSENGVPIEEDVTYDYANRYTLEAASDDDFYYVQPGFTTPKLHLNREARFYGSLGFDGGVWYGQGRTNDEETLVVAAKSGQTAGIQTDLIGSFTYSATGYFAKKLAHFRTSIPSTTVGFSTQSYAWPIVRLADMYLLYAEALNEVSGPSADVYTYIDIVRERAGLDGVVNSWATYSDNPGKPTSQEGLRAIIHQERMIELVFEGNRFWDLRRWKRAPEFMNEPIRGWNVNGTTTSTYYNVQTLFQPSFTNKDYFWPLSLDTVLRNESLIQNPGW